MYTTLVQLCKAGYKTNCDNGDGIVAQKVVLIDDE